MIKTVILVVYDMVIMRWQNIVFFLRYVDVYEDVVEEL